MDLASIRARMREQIGNPTTANVGDPVLDVYIQAAYTQIATRWRFHRNRVWVTFPTAGNQASYALNALDTTIHRVWDITNNIPLRKISGIDLGGWDTTVSAPTNTGRPRGYFRDGANIRLYPTPDQVYTIGMFVTRTPAPLTGPTDVPIIPETWHDLIPIWARWLYFEHKGDLPKAQYAYNLIELWLKTKPNEHDEEDQSYIHSVEVTSLTTPVRARYENFHTEDFTR